MQGIPKLLSLLRLFKMDAPEWHVDRIQATFRWSKDQAQRNIDHLMTEGLLHSYQPDCYVLGPALCELFNIFAYTDPFSRSCLRAVSELERRHKVDFLQMPETLSFTLHRDVIMCVSRYAHLQPSVLQDGMIEGFRVGLKDGAAPLVIMAHLDEARTKGLLLKDKADGGRRQLWRMTDSVKEQIRTEGYAFWNHATKNTMREIGAPVFGLDGMIAGSIVQRIKKAQCPDDKPDAEIVTQLIETADRASTYLQAWLIEGDDAQVATPPSPSAQAKAEAMQKELKELMGNRSEREPEPDNMVSGDV